MSPTTAVVAQKVEIHPRRVGNVRDAADFLAGMDHERHNRVPVCISSAVDLVDSRCHSGVTARSLSATASDRMHRYAANC